jgi:hypothetical protein
MKPGGDQLIHRPVRDQIAGNLLDDEPVIRKVAVECIDDPVPVRPHLAVVVEMNSVSVRVARGVEPVAAAMLAPLLRFKKSVHIALVGLGGLVVDERLHRLRFRRQPCQIEGDAPRERSPVGLLGGLQTGCFQLCQHEPVNRASHPADILYRG